MEEIRCIYCNRLLFKYALAGIGFIEIKCKKCGLIKKYTIKGEV